MLVEGALTEGRSCDQVAGGRGAQVEVWVEGDGDGEFAGLNERGSQRGL